MHLKLERLAIPNFDGTLEQWLAFKDAFETMVHQQDFPEVYKLAKLRQAVHGSAKALVGGIYTGGYESVWQALKDRYDSPRKLAEIHVTKILSLAKLVHENQEDLLFVVDTVKQSLRALKVMKLPVEHWDALLVPILLTKLPHSTQQAFGMNQNDKIPALEELLNFIERRANNIQPTFMAFLPNESCKADVNQRNPSGIVASKGFGANPGPDTRKSRLLRSNLAKAAPGNCRYCNKAGHKISNCPDLLKLTVAERFQNLKQSDLCFNCLAPGHGTKDCPSTNCRNCNGRHHTLLCRRLENNPPAGVAIGNSGEGSSKPPQIHP